MKKILTLIIGTFWFWLSTFSAIAQDTTPKGPAEWTLRNWLGFCIQIIVFVLVIIGIYKLAMGGKRNGGVDMSVPGAKNRDEDSDLVEDTPGD